MARKSFAVFGLGEFGKSVAQTLYKSGCDVIAIDKDMEVVHDIADTVTQAMALDCSDPDDLRNLGLENLDSVVVAVSGNLEASIMITMVAKECGVPYVLAKARNGTHAEVLKKIGADRVVFPERATGIRLAKNMISGNFLDMIELSSKFSIMEISVPGEWIGKTMREMHLRGIGINVIARKERDSINTYLDPDQPFVEKDRYLILGPNDALNKLQG